MKKSNPYVFLLLATFNRHRHVQFNVTASGC